MQVTVRLHGFRELGRERSEELGDGSDGTALLQQLGIPTEACLLFRDDTPVPVDTPLHDGDEVRVVRITSGG